VWQWKTYSTVETWDEDLLNEDELRFPPIWPWHEDTPIQASVPEPECHQSKDYDWQMLAVLKCPDVVVQAPVINNK
jgi:hypothetical protein